MDESLVVIGGGPTGIEAARAAAQLGMKVTLISEGPLGGRAGWHSLLPSKVWLAAADAAGYFADSADLGWQRLHPEFRADELVRRIQLVKQTWSRQQQTGLEELGVQIVQGVASFHNEREVQLQTVDGGNGQTVKGTAFIVATGSVPTFPPELKPDGKKVIAPRFAGHLERLPPSMLVIGAGATGCEMAYAFNRLGVEVTWIVDQFGILPALHPDLGAALGRALVKQGVRLVQGEMATHLERGDAGVTAELADGARFSADMAFVAIGRRPDWERLNLEAVGVEIESDGSIATDEYGRSAQPHIYFAGDAAGGWMLANKAMSQARVAARHAAGAPTLPYDGDSLIQVIFTDPQIAQVGVPWGGPGVNTVRIRYRQSLKAHILHELEGFLELAYHEHSRVLLGGMAAGLHAASLLAPVALAMRQKVTVDELAQVFVAHPALEELPFLAARAARDQRSPR